MGSQDRFPKKVLRAQDGKRVPLTMGSGGPVVGEAIFRYEEDTGQLVFDARLNGGQIENWLMDEWAHFEEGEN